MISEKRLKMNKKPTIANRISSILLSSVLVFTLFFGSTAQSVQANSLATTAPAAFGKSTPAKQATNQPLEVKLTWGNSSGATKYEYCIDGVNNSACDATWKSVGTKTSVKVSGLAAGSYYYWQVRAVNSTGTTYANGSQGVFWRFQTGTAPRTFNKKSVGNDTTNQPASPTLTWGTSSNATGYEYCIDTSNNSACDTSWKSAGNAKSVTLHNLKANTTYYWQVRAVNSMGTVYANGNKSDYWRFRTGSLPKISKKGIENKATSVSTTPTISWSPKTLNTTYEYCIDTTNDGACTTSWISTGSATSATLNLDSATTYYWQVRATNNWGTYYANGSSSSFYKFTTE
jgi:hypothetical protein